MFASTGVALQTGETSIQANPCEEGLDAALDHGPQRARAGLEALLVSVEVLVEVGLEDAIELGSFRTPRAVKPWRLADSARTHPPS